MDGLRISTQGLMAAHERAGHAANQVLTATTAHDARQASTDPVDISPEAQNLHNFVDFDQVTTGLLSMQQAKRDAQANIVMIRQQDKMWTALNEIL